MRISIHADYNFRWFVVFAGTVALLVGFVVTNLA